MTKTVTPGLALFVILLSFSCNGPHKDAAEGKTDTHIETAIQNEVSRNIQSGAFIYTGSKTTGEILATLELPANQAGIPMTYSVNGKQYIIIAVGADEHPEELIALSL